MMGGTICDLMMRDSCHPSIELVSWHPTSCPLSQVAQMAHMTRVAGMAP